MRRGGGGLTEAARALRPAPRRKNAALDLSTPRLLVGSFAALCLLGTLGFLVLPGLWIGERPAFIDALFMATSAVGVTALSVVDVSSRLSFAGQLWLLALIQAGGLGSLTFAASAAHALGARTGFELEAAVCGPTSFLPTRNPWRLLPGRVKARLAGVSPQSSRSFGLPPPCCASPAHGRTWEKIPRSGWSVMG